MFSFNETQLLFTLIENEAISLDFATLISGYDATYPGDLVESIGQSGIEIRCIEIEGFDAKSNPVTTRALILPESEHTKVAAIIHSRIKYLLEQIDPEDVFEDLQLIRDRYTICSSLKGGTQVC